MMPYLFNKHSKKLQESILLWDEICQGYVKGSDGMANSVNPDQTAPSGAV